MWSPPGRLDLTAYRGTGIINPNPIVFEGYAFYDTNYYLTVRLFRDAPGAPLLYLPTVADAATEGLTGEVFEEDGVTSTRLTIKVLEATIAEVMPFATSGRPADDPDVRMFYDLHIQPFEEPRFRGLEGNFIISAGVTRP